MRPLGSSKYHASWSEFLPITDPLRAWDFLKGQKRRLEVMGVCIVYPEIVVFDDAIVVKMRLEMSSPLIIQYFVESWVQFTERE